MHFTGTDAVRQNFIRWFSEYDGSIDLETHDLSITIEGDIAIAHMLHRDTGEMGDSATTRELWLRSTVCCRKEAGRWSVFHEHISTPVDLATMKAESRAPGGRSMMLDKTILNPWTWGDEFGFVQGVDSSAVRRVIHLAGQGDQRNDDGSPRNAGDMEAQIAGALDNVEKVLDVAGLDLSAVTRLNIYTTDIEAFLPAHHVPIDRLDAAGCRASSTLVGVTRLAFADMLVELEATALD